MLTQMRLEPSEANYTPLVLKTKKRSFKLPVDRLSLNQYGTLTPMGKENDSSRLMFHMQKI